VHRQVLAPVVAEMSRRGTPFVGLLYAGLAMTATGPQVIEFNCRFGDPETQVVLPLLETPLAELLLACANGRLGNADPAALADAARRDRRVAAEGYPGQAHLGRRDHRRRPARRRAGACTPAPVRRPARSCRPAVGSSR
jgi:phosphoribosylamine--glycine ligase